MPRNSSGVYSLPESPFVPGTTIESTPVNSNFDDIATALTGSLPRDGSAPMSAPLELANGTVTAPSLTFTNSPGTGWYRISDNVIGYTVNGTLAYSVTTSGILDLEVGLSTANVNNSGVNVLDWYLEGSFTPLLSFGGATTGITYSFNFASFTRIGNIVFFSVNIGLTSKGTATGAASISGIPYTPSARAVATISLWISFDSAVILLPCYTLIESSPDRIDLWKPNSGGTGGTPILDSNFTDSSSFTITGFYVT